MKNGKGNSAAGNGVPALQTTNNRRLESLRHAGKRRGLFMVLVVVVILMLLVMPGCNSGDIWGSLFEANSYIATVGQNMHARGWPDFPDNAVAWTMFVSDLKSSISSAKSAGVRSTGAIRDIENKIMTVPDPDMKSLAEAFDSHGEW